MRVTSTIYDSPALTVSRSPIEREMMTEVTDTVLCEGAHTAARTLTRTNRPRGERPLTTRQVKGRHGPSTMPNLCKIYMCTHTCYMYTNIQTTCSLSYQGAGSFQMDPVAGAGFTSKQRRK